MPSKTLQLDYTLLCFTADRYEVACGEAGAGQICRTQLKGKVHWCARNDRGHVLGWFDGPGSKVKAVSRVVQYLWATHYLAANSEES